MAVTKEVKTCPDFKERKQSIDAVLGEVNDLSQDELATFATKMNYAAANGMLPILNQQEQAALRTLSQKFIPEVPKQINLNAQVKTENVILGFLQNNDRLLSNTKMRVIEQSAIELDQLAKLEDFKGNFQVSAEDGEATNNENFTGEDDEEEGEQ